MSTIICGSKKYENRNFNDLVDSFETIVRSNMLLPDMGYGLKDSNIQVCNSHVFQHYQQKADVNKLYQTYKVKTDIDHVKKFYNFFMKSNAKFTHYPQNNTKLMNNLIKSNGVVCDFNKGSLLKCGLSYVAECISNNNKPFLIGFSLCKKDLEGHTYNKHKKLYHGHDHNGEIDLIIALHKKELIDASFCLIQDTEDLSFSDEFEPTKESLEILKC